jgi:hypothetical protein
VKPVGGNYPARAIPVAFEFLRRQIDFISGREISELIDVSQSRVSAMLREGVITQDGRGRYARKKTLYDLFRWMRKRLGEGKSTLGELRRQRLLKQNRLLDVAVAGAERSTIPVDVADRAWATLVLACRQKFLRLANKVAPRIPFLKSEQEIETEIQREIDEALAELARPVNYGGETFKANSQ